MRRVALLDGLLTVLLGGGDQRRSTKISQFGRTWASWGYTPKALFSPAISAVLGHTGRLPTFTGRFLEYSEASGLQVRNATLTAMSGELTALVYGPKASAQEVYSLARVLLDAPFIAPVSSTRSSEAIPSQFTALALEAFNQWARTGGLWLQNPATGLSALLAANQQLYLVLSLLPTAEYSTLSTSIL